MDTTVEQLNPVERAFVQRWASMDFTGWNEQAVREELIIHLLHALGYRKGTTFDLQMEKELVLSEPYHRIGRRKVAIDYAPSLRLRHFWIVEAKPGTQRPMDFGDLLQAHLYAIHPEVQARLIMLCNGWEVRVYDALTVRSFDDAVYSSTKDDGPAGFLGLRKILGSETLLAHQRGRVLSLIKETLDVEVDAERFRSFKAEMTAVLRDGEHKVRDNADKLQATHWAEFFRNEAAELAASSIDNLLVRMDFPVDSRRPPAEEFVRRVLAASGTDQAALVDRLAMVSRARPHNTFRSQALYVLVRLQEEGVVVPESPYVRGIPRAIEDLARSNINYWSHASRALCHLDNAAMRVAYKFCTRLTMDFMAKLIGDAKSAMTTERRIGLNPSVARAMIPSVGHLQEILWRKFSSKQEANEIWEGIWSLCAVERELDALPAVPYPDAEPDLLFWEHEGVRFDHLRQGTWNALHRKVPLLRAAGVAEDVLAFAESSLEDVRAKVPQPSPAPDKFQPLFSLAELFREVVPKVLMVRVASILSQIDADPIVAAAGNSATTQSVAKQTAGAKQTPRASKTAVARRAPEAKKTAGAKQTPKANKPPGASRG